MEDPNLPPLSTEQTVKVEEPHLKGTPHNLDARLSPLDEETKEMVQKALADKYNSERNFKVASEQLRKAEMKLNEIATREQEAEAKRLAEQGQFKELAEKAEARARAAEDQLHRQSLQSSLERELMSAGALDTELLSTALQAKYGDELKASPALASDLVNRLKEEKPMLFKMQHVVQQRTTQSTGQSLAQPAAGQEKPSGINALDKKDGKFTTKYREVEAEFDKLFSDPSRPLF